MKPLSLLLAVALGERAPRLFALEPKGGGGEGAKGGDLATRPCKSIEIGHLPPEPPLSAPLSPRLGERGLGGTGRDRVLVRGGRGRGPPGQETGRAAAAPGPGGTAAPAGPGPRALPPSAR